jgi:hypothetical protein
LGNSLKLQPTHRDLLVTPPFVIGVLDMQIETAMEGSPIYTKRVSKKELSWVNDKKI